MQELDLSPKELEQAFQVVNQAWLEAEGEVVELEIPPHLHHLTQDQWEQICWILTELTIQQEYSQIH
jgi:hypothetical protein